MQSKRDRAMAKLDAAVSRLSTQQMVLQQEKIDLAQRLAKLKKPGEMLQAAKLREDIQWITGRLIPTMKQDAAAESLELKVDLHALQAGQRAAIAEIKAIGELACHLRDRKPWWVRLWRWMRAHWLWLEKPTPRTGASPPMAQNHTITVTGLSNVSMTQFPLVMNPALGEKKE